MCTYMYLHMYLHDYIHVPTCVHTCTSISSMYLHVYIHVAKLHVYIHVPTCVRLLFHQDSVRDHRSTNDIRHILYDYKGVFIKFKWELNSKWYKFNECGREKDIFKSRTTDKDEINSKGEEVNNWREKRQLRQLLLKI